MNQNRKIEDYMKTIFLLSESGVARGSYIAKELKVSKPTVSVSLKEMEEQGYLTILENRTIQLTEKGEEIAKSVVKRNRIIYDLLVDLGVDSKTASDDACQIEHSISEDSVKALTELTKYLKLIRQNPFVGESSAK